MMERCMKFWPDDAREVYTRVFVPYPCEGCASQAEMKFCRPITIFRPTRRQSCQWIMSARHYIFFTLKSTAK